MTTLLVYSAVLGIIVGALTSTAVRRRVPASWFRRRRHRELRRRIFRYGHFDTRASVVGSRPL